MNTINKNTNEISPSAASQILGPPFPKAIGLFSFRFFIVSCVNGTKAVSMSSSLVSTFNSAEIGLCSLVGIQEGHDKGRASCKRPQPEWPETLFEYHLMHIHDWSGIFRGVPPTCGMWAGAVCAVATETTEKKAPCMKAYRAFLIQISHQLSSYMTENQLDSVIIP